MNNMNLAFYYVFREQIEHFKKLKNTFPDADFFYFTNTS